MFGLDEPTLEPLDESVQLWTESVVRTISADRLKSDVYALPAPRNRLHSPEAMEDADELILQAFREAGWTVDYRYYEMQNGVGVVDYEKGRFPAGIKPAIYREVAGANVLGIKEGQASRDTIIVGAHHDTIRDSPGADDNTASVAALMELARVLAPYSFRDTIMLAAFDMEEIGRFGSTALVKQLSEERTIKAAIVYETMSYIDHTPNTQLVPKGLRLFYPQQAKRISERKFAGDWNLVIYRNSSAHVARAFGTGLAHVAGDHVPMLMRDPVDLAIVKKFLRYVVPFVNNFGRSDNYSFWKAGIPAIMITDTADFRNPNYHQPTDTPDTLDYNRLAEIVAATAVTLAQIAGLVTPIDSQSAHSSATAEYALNHTRE